MDSLVVRLKEQIRIYKDSPNVNATYIDLSRLIEDLIEILEKREIKGFNNKTE